MENINFCCIFFHKVVYSLRLMNTKGGGRLMYDKVRLKFQLVSVCLIIFLIFSSFPIYANMEETLTFSFSGGEGTMAKPYLIATLDDVLDLYDATLNMHYNSASYTLMQDIDLGTHVWKPIGGKKFSFQGVFDGNNKKIIIRKIEEGEKMGLFSSLARNSVVKNLIINGQINMSLNLKESISFGLITGQAEGKIENCIVEGKVELITNGKSEFFFGGIAGRLNGSIISALNKANLTLSRNEPGKSYIGGIAGESMSAGTVIKNSTNQGAITGVYKGSVNAGGLVGFSGFGSKIENVLNTAHIVMKQNFATPETFSYIGGISGELRDAGIDKALNQGNVFIEDTGVDVNQSIVAAGITGLSEMALLRNIGNEGNVETKVSREQHAIGITKPGTSVVIENAYTKGNIYASTSNPKSDIYVMGLGEKATTSNFYFSGSAKMKAGNLGEVKSDAIANIRPGDKTNLYNYSYWHSQYDPFPGYPTFNKPSATAKAFNISTGKLSETVNIGGVKYSDVSSALNAWVKMKNAGYLTWKYGNEPTFDWQFGYIMPDSMTYTHTKEGKWLSTSTWALAWMEKADQLSLIPDVLINQDMTKGITRKEFSALAIKLYEQLKGSPLTETFTSPFKDVDSMDVSRAYSLGIVTGVGENLFSPDSIITREQACTMLTRVYKAVYWEGWSLENDSSYTLRTLDIEGVEKFEDDNLISIYAKSSVYFMTKQGIIAGIGNDVFAPSPSSGRPENYGRATREQAFKIALAMIEKFK